MNPKIELVRHKGARIVLSDYSGLNGDALTGCIHDHNAEIQALIENGTRDILFLTDVTNVMANKDAVQLLKETAKMNLPYTKKSAAVGVVGVQKVLLQAINLFSALETRPFDTREQAMDWLAD